MKLENVSCALAACNCDTHGSLGVSCDSEGKCQCHHNFDGATCDKCLEGFYNFPSCEGKLFCLLYGIIRCVDHLKITGKINSLVASTRFDSNTLFKSLGKNL